MKLKISQVIASHLNDMAILVFDTDQAENLYHRIKFLQYLNFHYKDSTVELDLDELEDIWRKTTPLKNENPTI